MYTLKIHHTRHEAKKGEALTLVDESTSFIPADRVIVHGAILGDEVESAMKPWDVNQYQNALGALIYDADGKDPQVQFADGRLITVERDGKSEWFLASRAWLLGPDGRTIERVAP